MFLEAEIHVSRHANSQIAGLANFIAFYTTLTVVKL